MFKAALHLTPGCSLSQSTFQELQQVNGSARIELAFPNLTSISGLFQDKEAPISCHGWWAFLKLSNYHMEATRAFLEKVI
jgi:hypothetical protein